MKFIQSIVLSASLVGGLAGVAQADCVNIEGDWRGRCDNGNGGYLTQIANITQNDCESVDVTWNQLWPQGKFPFGAPVSDPFVTDARQGVQSNSASAHQRLDTVTLLASLTFNYTTSGARNQTDVWTMHFKKVSEQDIKLTTTLHRVAADVAGVPSHFERTYRCEMAKI